MASEAVVYSPETARVLQSISNGDFATADNIITNHPDIVNAINISEEEATILQYAVKCQQMEITKRILQSKPDLDLTNKDGLTALHFATKAGDLDLCQLLIEYGASMVNSVCGSPLALAVTCNSGNIKLIEYFISCGADPHRDSKHLVIEAIVHSHLSVLKYLLGIGCDVNKKNDTMYPLHVAAAKGHSDIAEVLLENGALVDVLDQNDSTPLIIAARTGHDDIVELLLQYGADVNIADRSFSSLTALHYASQLEKTNCLHSLIKYGADPNRPDSTGFTCLLKAVSAYNFDTVVILLKENADVNMFGSIPKRLNDRLIIPITPLEFAVQAKWLNAAALLIHCGANHESLIKSKALLKQDSIDIDTQLVLKLINYSLSNAPTLLELVRFKIRDYLGCPVCKKISSMHIPLKLKQYLQFSDECQDFIAIGEQNVKRRGIPVYWAEHDR